MDTDTLMSGLVMFLCFIVIVTVHEWAHAWVAWKLGDNTAYNEGRVTLNPQSHICPIGTLAVPLGMVLLSAMGSGIGSLLVGWGRPVPVNLYNLENRSRDHSLIALAGPAMNLVLAFVCLGLLRVFMEFEQDTMMEAMQTMAILSIFLCWLNLLPIPPLDGSHVMKYIIGMREETYANIAQYGIFILIVALQIQPIGKFLHEMTFKTLIGMATVLGIPA
ncbi:MAG: site-2 protease family protein [Limisphaerales bacterium]